MRPNKIPFQPYTITPLWWWWDPVFQFLPWWCTMMSPGVPAAKHTTATSPCRYTQETRWSSSHKPWDLLVQVQPSCLPLLAILNHENLPCARGQGGHTTIHRHETRVVPAAAIHQHETWCSRFHTYIGAGGGDSYLFCSSSFIPFPVPAAVAVAVVQQLTPAAYYYFLHTSACS